MGKEEVDFCVEEADESFELVLATLELFTCECLFETKDEVVTLEVEILGEVVLVTFAVDEDDFLVEELELLSEFMLVTFAVDEDDFLEEELDFFDVVVDAVVECELLVLFDTDTLDLADVDE